MQLRREFNSISVVKKKFSNLPNHIKNQIRNLSLKKVKEEVFNLFGEIKGEGGQKAVGKTIWGEKKYF